MVELTNDKLIKIKAICVHLESGGFLNCAGGAGLQVLPLGISSQDIDGLYLFAIDATWGESGRVTHVETVLLFGWRWRIDRLLEAVPDNKPIAFWGWGVDPTGYIFPILGNDSDCERVQFTPPYP